ncbi:MAG TPA: c-type cytochrome [Terriglobales bacterium]|nr:c-type cytochrome [Terriglobales bacterium]
MPRLKWFLIGAASLLALGFFTSLILVIGARGFSAREQPTVLERIAARSARSLAMPTEAKARTNPTANSPEVIAEGLAHWADHCAACHGNNGSGDTEMGKHMYPPAPDMRQAATQDLTDGELFYIIQNGIRLTGMPGWGNGTSHDEQDSWKLVRFIRHLPNLSASEEQQMKELNPKSPDELKEEQEEQQFLKGDQPNEQTKHDHH